MSDFKCKHVIGSGGFGKVYLAKLESANQLFAIKNIRKDRLADKNELMKAAFIEYQVMFETKHPFLCNMEYFFQTNERFYFVMPLIKAGDLHRMLQEESRFSEERVKFYAGQIVVALGYLHDNNIMHRDLKLENMMVDGDGYLKLIDFGLSKKIRPG